MHLSTDLSDDEFVPFLQSLGVETYNKSFEWLLNNPEFGSVLRWLYDNLDHNNALNAREEYRYVEIEQKGRLLPKDELESSISAIEETYNGICLPGDHDEIEDMKLDIHMQEQRRSMIEKQMQDIEALIKQNELTNEKLNIQITELNAAHQQSVDDEKSAAEECVALAEEVEVMTDGIVGVVADTLQVYANCKVDKDIAKKFLTYGPLESYRQSQALFRSQFDLYAQKRLSKRNDDGTSDQELRDAMLEAKVLEERLYDAICAYADGCATFAGKSAILMHTDTYSPPHPTHLNARMAAAQSAVQLLEHEESAAWQQLQHEARNMACARAERLGTAVSNAALARRRQVQSELTLLVEKATEALLLDSALYYSLRVELCGVQQLRQFAAQLREYLLECSAASKSRTESMVAICAEHDAVEARLKSSDPLLTIISSVLSANSIDAPTLVKLYMDLQTDIKKLTDNVKYCYKEKEISIDTFIKSTRDLHAYVYDGCTKQANCMNRSVSELAHAVEHARQETDARLAAVVARSIAVKDGDKKCLRKLWQWFLTDHEKLLAFMNELPCKSNS